MTQGEAFAWIGAAALLLLVAASQRAALLDLAPDDGASDLGDGSLEQTQGTGGAFQVAAALADFDVSAMLTSPSDANRAAFLHALRWAEGTASSDGYSIMFGGRRFGDFSDHPRDPMQFTDGKGRRLWSSAAGAYQFMAVSPIPGGGSTAVNTWDRLQAKLGLPDFSPASQDAAALELIREAGALDDVDAGRLADAVRKVRRIWASLPGAGYDQPERSLSAFADQYENGGGTIAA